MTVVGIPTTMPIPIPWPGQTPGHGTPYPSPSTGGGNTTTPVLTTPTGGGGITGPFADLFAFTPPWLLIGALLLVAFSVELVDQTYPEYVWMYVGILLLAIIITSKGFTPQLDAWLRR